MSLSLNLGALKTPTVLVKLLQTVVGAICFGLLADLDDDSIWREHSLLFMTVFSFLLTTSLLLVSSVLSGTVAEMMPKTLFEFLYHLTALVLYAVASINLATHVSKNGDSGDPEHSESVTVVVLSFANAVFYGVSTYFSFRSYRAS